MSFSKTGQLRFDALTSEQKFAVLNAPDIHYAIDCLGVDHATPAARNALIGFLRSWDAELAAQVTKVAKEAGVRNIGIASKVEVDFVWQAIASLYDWREFALRKFGTIAAFLRAVKDEAVTCGMKYPSRIDEMEFHPELGAWLLADVAILKSDEALATTANDAASSSDPLPGVVVVLCDPSRQAEIVEFINQVATEKGITNVRVA